MRALNIFKSRLAVKRGTLYYAIEISFTSYDAEKAARIANAIFDAYIDAEYAYIDAEYQATLRARNWLQERIRDLRKQVSAAEQAVVDYRRGHQAVIQEAENNQAQVLSDLESKSKTFRGLYENFLQRYLDTVQQQYRPTEARLISPAARPSRQSSPKAFPTLVFSACAGIIFGFGIGVWRSKTPHLFPPVQSA